MERPSAASLASFFLPPEGPGEGSVAAIALRPEDDAALRGLREVLASGDRSRAALEATDAAIGANPAGYTAWQVRRECLESMAEAEPAGRDALVKGEMEWVTRVGSENPKNYQVGRARFPLCLPSHSSLRPPKGALWCSLVPLGSSLINDNSDATSSPLPPHS